MRKPCSEANCPNFARARGLCHQHYCTKWKVSALPPKEKRVLLVRVKLYLTKDQALRMKRRAMEKSVTLSSVLRELVEKEFNSEAESSS